MKKASKVTDMTIKLTTDKFLFLPRQILHDTRVKNSYTKLVYVALVDAIDSRNDKNEELRDTANISQAALAEMTCLSKPTVKKAIEELESLGYVEIVEDEIGFKKIYKVNRESMEIELSPTDTLMTVCKKGLKADCKKYGIELENGDTVKMHWYKDTDGKYPVIDEEFLAELVKKAEDTAQDKVEDIPAEVIEDKPVENAPVVEDKPARKRVKLLAVKKTSNADTSVKTSNVESARKSKFKVVKKALDNEFKTSNVGKIKRV